MRTLGEACQLRPPKSEVRRRLQPAALVSFLPMEDLCIDGPEVVPIQTRALSAVDGSYTYFAEGDVLLAKITPCFENGKLGIAAGLTNGVGFGSSEYFVLRPQPGLTKEWLYYYLARERFRDEGAARMSGAVGHKRVQKEFLEGYPIPVPPIPEQQRIVRTLDEAFARIAAVKEKTAASLRNARAVLEAEMDLLFGRRGDEWVDESVSQLVARGILVKPFDGNHGDRHPTRADYVPSGVPFIMASDLVDGRVDITSCHFIARELADSLRVGFARNGDVMLSHKGTIGRSAIVGGVDDYIMLTPQVTAYRIRDPKSLSAQFLRYYFMSPIFQRELTAAAGDGSTRAYIGIIRQLGLRIRMPAIREQREIVELLDALVSSVRKLVPVYTSKLAALDELKQFLLHHAFTGQL